MATGINQAKLVKILALTKSTHDGEALSAMRAAQRILAAAGLTLSDMVAANLVAANSTAIDPVPAQDDANSALELALRDSRAQLARKTWEAARHAAEARDLRGRVDSLEKALARSNRDSEGWRRRA